MDNKENISYEAVKVEINELIKLINYHNNLYYNKGEPVITDVEFDQLFYRLKSLEEQYPSLQKPSSPTKKISLKATKNKVKHRSPMLSLNNCFDEHDFSAFLVNNNSKTGLKPINYIVEEKVDGVAFNAIFFNGKLKNVLTRGDGLSGEPIIDYQLKIKDLPEKIPSQYKVLEVRGELYLEKQTLIDLNKQRLENNLPPFSNCRNLTAGIVKTESKEKITSRLNYVVYGVGYCDSKFAVCQSDAINKLGSLGFSINKNYYLFNKEPRFYEILTKSLKKRDSLNYDIDGLVVKVDNFYIQDILGSNSKFPNYAIAYKFPGIICETVLTNIAFQVGRTGLITPVAILEPVNIGGVRISRATLHNFSEIERMDIRVGDLIYLERAGDVIPKVNGVNLSGRKTKLLKFVRPRYCPSCSSLLSLNKSGNLIYCLNKFYCKSQLSASVKHFSSSNGLNITGLGDVLINQLVNTEIITKLVDIYVLKDKKHELIKNTLLKEKAFNNLILQINRSRKVSLQKFIYSLGIPGIGEVKSTQLANELKTASSFIQLLVSASNNNSDNKIFDLSVSKILGTSGIQEIKVFSGNKQNISSVTQLLQELIVIDEPLVTEKDNLLSNKKIVFSGTFKNFKKSQGAEIAKRLGAVILSDVSKNTDYLVYGSGSGLKLERAKKYKIQLLTEDEWLNLIKTII